MSVASPPLPCTVIERSGTTFMVVDADGNHVATVSGRAFAERVRDMVNAPAREEDLPVAWRWRFTADAYGVDGASPGEWKHQEAREQVPVAGQWRVEQQPLYTHPAAPSADKLRIAVEGIEAARRQINDGQAEAAHYNLGTTLDALKGQP